MAIILKNNSSDALSYLGATVVVPANSTLTVDSAYWFGLLADTTFMSALKKNNLIINDGIADYNYPESEEVLRRAVRDENTANRDTDGAMITRNKAAKKGWTFCSLPFEFETARLSDALFCQDSSGATRPFVTLKAYNANGEEVTSPGLAGINYTTIVKTVIDFEPPYDYEVIGGDLRTLTPITEDVRLWLVAAPDIPAPNGSKEMGGGINLKFLTPSNVWSVDGRVTKYATYHPVLHTNKIRLILKYPPGVNETLTVIVQLYKL
jgi:hypothetical protein